MGVPFRFLWALLPWIDFGMALTASSSTAKAIVHPTPPPRQNSWHCFLLGCNEGGRRKVLRDVEVFARAEGDGA